jgi:hypothetical protein
MGKARIKEYIMGENDEIEVVNGGKNLDGIKGHREHNL